MIRLKNAFTLAVLLSTTTSLAGAENVPIAPVERADFGRGIVMANRTSKLNKCVTYTGVDDRVVPGRKAANFNYLRSTADLRESMNFDFAAAAGVHVAVLDATISNRLRMLRESRINTDSQALEVSIVAEAPPRYVQGPKLAGDWPTKILAPGGLQAFKDACGDVFVDGMQESFELHGIASLQTSSESVARELSNVFSTTGRVAKVANWEALVDLDKKLAKQKSTERVKVDMDSTDVNSPQPKNIAELTDRYTNFLPKGNGFVKRLWVRSYSELENWPSKEALAAAKDPDDRVLEPLMNISWEIQSYLGQIQDVRNGVRPAAVGDAATRRGWDAHLAKSETYLTKLRDALSNSYHVCQAYTRTIGTIPSQCSALANWWLKQNPAAFAQLVPKPARQCGIAVGLPGEGGGIADFSETIPGREEPVTSVAITDYWKLFEPAVWDRYDGSDDLFGDDNDYELTLSLEAYKKDDIKLKVVEAIKETGNAARLEKKKTKMRNTQWLRLRPTEGCFFADRVTDNSPGEGSKLADDIAVGPLERHTAVLRGGKNSVRLNNNKYISEITCTLSSSKPRCDLLFTSTLPIPKVTYQANYKSGVRLTSAQALLADPAPATLLSETEKVGNLPPPPPPMNAQEISRAAAAAGQAAAAAGRAAAIRGAAAQNK